MPEDPLVSVLMTVYNRENYISAAIESVLGSTYSNFELIIVDDCSTDSSVAIARKYELADKRIKVLVNEKNLTDYPNRNKAASYAKGKYIKYLDSDDVLYPFGLAMMVKRMEEFPNAAIAFAKRGLKEKPFPVYLTPEESYTISFIKGNFLFGNAPTSVMIRNQIFQETGGFSGLNQLGDSEYWMKVAALFPILLMEGDVTWNRDHPLSEKYKDSDKVKSRLRFNLIEAALKSKGCPLSMEDKKLAISKLHKAFKNSDKFRVFRKLVSVARRKLKL